MAFKPEVILFNNRKPCGNLLVVGHAIRIETLHYAIYVIRNLNHLLAAYLKVLNLDDGGMRSYQRNFVEFFWQKVFVAYFNNALGAIFLAFEICGKQHHVFKRIKLQYAYNLKHSVGRDMINTVPFSMAETFSSFIFSLIFKCFFVNVLQ